MKGRRMRQVTVPSERLCAFPARKPKSPLRVPDHLLDSLGQPSPGFLGLSVHLRTGVGRPNIPTMQFVSIFEDPDGSISISISPKATEMA